MKKYKVIRSLVSTGKYSDFISNIMALSDNTKSSYVCVANVHMTIEAYDSVAFLDVVNGADITTPDGMPLAKAIKFIYDINQDRVAGMDLMPSLMRVCEEKGKSIFLYGSTEATLEKIQKKAKLEFPLLKLDAYSPPFRKLTQEEEFSVVSKINEEKYDFVFVALGCPKQEKWMAAHKGILHSCMIGLGGALEVYAEVKDRAPQWVQDYSLEWVYRLVQDPKRLWKRYLYTNNKFIILFLQQLILQKFHDKKGAIDE
ncbi:MAG: WecB/TagA/CpsF family glycosyltransferase [Sulfurimonas sp.]